VHRGLDTNGERTASRPDADPRFDANEVLLCGDQRRSEFLCPPLERSDLGFGVRVMIGERDEIGQSQTESFEVGSETFRVSDATKRQSALRRGGLSASGVKEPEGTVIGAEHRCSVVETPNHPFDLGMLALPAAARDQQDVGPRQGGRRLAQRPRGQQPPIPEGGVGIEQDDIEIARQPAVLESVVEDQDVRVLVCCGQRTPSPIGPHDYDRLRNLSRQEERLVAGTFHGDAGPNARRDDHRAGSGAPPIASTENRRASPELE
jgi:hypothetical protein